MEVVTITPEIEIADDVLSDLCRRYQVKALYVFGSAARNEMRPDSDVDFMVELQPNHTIGLRFFDLQRELAQLVGRKVDLESKESLNRHRAPHIWKDAHLLYEER